jgi:hypothetical protein
MIFLKQSTAYTPLIGPFLDETDGKTAETALTIAQADVRLSKNGGNMAQKNEATSCTHDELGYYTCPLDTTDIGTLGKLQLMVHESGALPVWHDFMVLPANVYDSLFSTDKLEVDLLQIGGVAQSATDLKDFADAGYDPATNKVQGVVLVDTVTDITNAVKTTQVILTGTASAGSATTITLTGGTATAGLYDGCLVVITAGTGAGQARTILSYAANTIATVTRDWVTAPSSDSVFSVYAADVAGLLEAGTATAGGASTITLDAGADTTVDIYKNNFIMITGGTGIGQCRLIGAYSAGRVATILPAWTTQPDATSVYQIIPFGWVDVGGVAGTAQTAGDLAALINALNDLSAADVNAEVDTALAELNLDHLMKIAVDTNFATTVNEDSVIGEIAQRGGANLWDRSTDSLEALRNTAPIGTTMRGTDSAALASVCTEGRLGELDAANLPSDIDAILADTGTDGVVLAADAITSAKIADDAISSEHLATGCLTADAFAADALVAATFATDSITNDALAASAVNEIWDATEAITGDAHSFETILARIYMFLQHKMNITDASGAMALRNTGDSADVMTLSITDNDTTTVRTKGAWV